MLHHFVYAFAINSGSALSESQGEQGSALLKATTSSVGGTTVGSAISSNGRGTIVLDVVQAAAPDGSTVFRVTESGFNAGKPFMCAAYGDTGNVVCNANDPLRTELLVLLHVAGNGFYSPSRLDAKRHWHEDAPGRNFSESADFTVTRVAGADVTIAIKRSGIQQQPPLHTAIDGTVIYDTGLQMPNSIDANLTVAPSGAPPATSRIDIRLESIGAQS